MMTKFPFSRLLISIVALLVLIVLHIIPMPILEVMALFVILARPRWFKDLVDRIYSE